MRQFNLGRRRFLPKLEPTRLPVLRHIDRYRFHRLIVFAFVEDKIFVPVTKKPYRIVSFSYILSLLYQRDEACSNSASHLVSVGIIHGLYHAKQRENVGAQHPQFAVEGTINESATYNRRDLFDVFEADVEIFDDFIYNLLVFYLN